MQAESAKKAWIDYELIDCGGGEKLERFGAFILARPEPQAVWSKSLSIESWESMADAYFKRDAQTNAEKGHWKTKKQMPDRWEIQYPLFGHRLRMRLAMTSFKHVGIFPEQAGNWEFIYQWCKANPGAQVLNLFAYTGGASLAARAAGAEVTHVDAVKPVITWAKENMERSGLDHIRWMVEDAFKFAQREVKRGKQYQMIVLDPPAYGRGPEGEKWELTEQIDGLMKQLALLMDSKIGSLILNLYSMGLSPLVAQTLVKSHFPHVQKEIFGEFYFEDRNLKKLPLGIFYRAQWGELCI